ncbi:MAG: hypothetical protein JXA57_09110 [Armatimonadetes bacterium]|nr:hypothetical protein [Armatimonadota bacterium]
MTSQKPKPIGTDTLFAKAGRLLIAGWMVGITAFYLQRLFSRIVSMAGALP